MKKYMQKNFGNFLHGSIMSQNLELKNLCATKKTSVDFLVAEDPSYSTVSKKDVCPWP